MGGWGSGGEGAGISGFSYYESKFKITFFYFLGEGGGGRGGGGEAGVSDFFLQRIQI